MVSGGDGGRDIKASGGCGCGDIKFSGRLVVEGRIGKNTLLVCIIFTDLSQKILIFQSISTNKKQSYNSATFFQIFQFPC